MSLRTVYATQDDGLSTTEAPAVEAAQFRQAMRRRASSVTVVTSADQHGFKLALTATAVTSVSLDPPLLLVCIDSRSRMASALRAGRPFVVHVLGAHQEALAGHFASRLYDKFDGIEYRLTPSGCPLLAGALASLECEVHHVYAGGDHTIFVGRVVATEVSDDDAQPLLYFAGRYIHP